MYLNLDNITTFSELKNIINNLKFNEDITDQKNLFHNIFLISDLENCKDIIKFKTENKEDTKSYLEKKFPELPNLYNYFEEFLPLIFENTDSKVNNTLIGIGIHKYFSQTHGIYNYNLWKEDYEKVIVDIDYYLKNRSDYKEYQKVCQQLKKKTCFMEKFYESNKIYRAVSEIYQLFFKEVDKKVKNVIKNKYLVKYHHQLQEYHQTGNMDNITQIESELYSNILEMNDNPEYSQQMKTFKNMMESELEKKEEIILTEMINHFGVYYTVSELLKLKIDEDEDEEMIVYFHEDPMITVH